MSEMKFTGRHRADGVVFEVGEVVFLAGDKFKGEWLVSELCIPTSRALVRDATGGYLRVELTALVKKAKPAADAPLTKVATGWALPAPMSPEAAESIRASIRTHVDRQAKELAVREALAALEWQRAREAAKSRVTQEAADQEERDRRASLELGRAVEDYLERDRQTAARQLYLEANRPVGFGPDADEDIILAERGGDRHAQHALADVLAPFDQHFLARAIFDVKMHAEATRVSETITGNDAKHFAALDVMWRKTKLAEREAAQAEARNILTAFEARKKFRPR